MDRVFAVGGGVGTEPVGSVMAQQRHGVRPARTQHPVERGQRREAGVEIAGAILDLALQEGVADLVLILFFTLVMQFVRYAFGGTGEVGLFVSLSWEIFGSFAFGGAVGAGDRGAA